MKLYATIHTAEDCGDSFKIIAQGQALGAAEWSPILSVTINTPNTERAQRTYHVGRKIMIKLEPRP